MSYPQQHVEFFWDPGSVDKNPEGLKLLIEEELTSKIGVLRGITFELRFTAIIAKIAHLNLTKSSIYNQMIDSTAQLITHSIPINPKIRSEEQFTYLCMHPDISAAVRQFIQYLKRQTAFRSITE